MTFLQWKAEVNERLSRQIPPATAAADWSVQNSSLFLPLALESNAPSDNRFALVKRRSSGVASLEQFWKIAASVFYFRSSERFRLLYSVAWRLTHGEPHLLQLATDSEMKKLFVMEKTITREVHKMHAFVRFKKVQFDKELTEEKAGVKGEGIIKNEFYIAWYEPSHPVLELAAPFFARRFPNMCWSILTPDGSAHWNRESLQYKSPDVKDRALAQSDKVEDLWRIYYSSIFNPARLKLKTMAQEMPSRYWGNLPEARMIQKLVQESSARIRTMKKSETTSAADYVPKTRTYESLKSASKKCRGCPLYKEATQTVFGKGSLDSKVVLVGEQPGDQEDIAGEPFVGPAGKLLGRALNEAGITQEEIYLTNAVKHFKFIPNEKGRRIHERPRGVEIKACRPWLQAELELLKPKVIVALGATASQSVLGRQVKVNEERGHLRDVEALEAKVLVTYHPSAILRSPDEVSRKRQYKELVHDLALLSKFL